MSFIRQAIILASLALAIAVCSVPCLGQSAGGAPASPAGSAREGAAAPAQTGSGVPASDATTSALNVLQGPAGSAPNGYFGDPQTLVARLESEIRASQANVSRLKDQAARAEQLYKAGQSSVSDVDAAKGQLAAEASRLDSLQRDLTTAHMRVALLRPIDVSLKDATVRQAGEAISQAAALPIRVAADVPSDIRLSVEAHGVPLSSVLSAIGEQARLMISPDGNGVLLKRWPSLDVNGKATFFPGRNAPWSDDWGGMAPQLESVLLATVPAGGTPSLDGQQMGVGAPQALPYEATPPGYEGTRWRVIGGLPGRQPVGVAALGDRLIVVAETGRDAKGTPGIWLTLYRLEGGQLVRAGATFHPSANRPNARMESPNAKGASRNKVGY